MGFVSAGFETVVDHTLPFSDAELAELALAADPDVMIPEDAVPFDVRGTPFGDLLPDWYMPAAAASLGNRRHTVVAAVIVLSLLAVNALGLCVTYGTLEVAW